MSVLYSPVIQAILSARSLSFDLIDVIQDLLKHILSIAMETADKETSNIENIEADYQHSSINEELMNSGKHYSQNILRIS